MDLIGLEGWLGTAEEVVAELDGAVGELDDGEVGAGLVDDGEGVGNGGCIVAEPCVECVDMKRLACDDELILVEGVGMHQAGVDDLVGVGANERPTDDLLRLRKVGTQGGEVYGDGAIVGRRDDERGARGLEEGRGVGINGGSRYERQRVMADCYEGVELQTVVGLHCIGQTERAPLGGHLSTIGYDVVAEDDIARKEDRRIVDVVRDLGEVDGGAYGQRSLQEGMFMRTAVVAVVGSYTIDGRDDGRIAHIDLGGVGTGTEGAAFGVGDHDVLQRDGVDALGQR